MYQIINLAFPEVVVLSCLSWQLLIVPYVTSLLVTELYIYHKWSPGDAAMRKSSFFPPSFFLVLGFSFFLAFMGFCMCACRSVWLDPSVPRDIIKQEVVGNASRGSSAL